VGTIPHPDFYKAQKFPDSDEWGYTAYGGDLPDGSDSYAVYPYCSPLFDYVNWPGYYFGALRGTHSDTRPIYGADYTARYADETVPDLMPADPFLYLGESWIEGSHILNSYNWWSGYGIPDAQGTINKGKQAGLGKLQPYKVLDSRFDVAGVKPWTGTGAGQQGKAYPLYTTSATITGLNNGTQYEVWIRCPNVNGERGYFYMLGTPGSSGLPVVGNISVKAPAGTTRELNISWDAVTDATAYRLYFSQFAANPKPTDSYTRVSDGTTATVTGLLPDTAYYVWVVAEKGGVAGEIGASVSGRTGQAPSVGIPGKPKYIDGTNYPVKTLMYVEVNDNNPLNAGSYILDDGAYLFDYVVIFASNIRSRNCALETEPHGCTRNGPHLHHNQNNRHVLTNASKYIKPLQDKGIKVLLGILPDHDGISLGTMNDAERAAFVLSVQQDVELYGLDGIDLDDEWASKENWDTSSVANNPTAESIWVYPVSQWWWPAQMTIYRNPEMGIEPGNGQRTANSEADQNRMWRELGVGTYKTISALRDALGSEKVITLYEYNTGRYVTPDEVNSQLNNNSQDTTITSTLLASKIDFSLNPMYNQYIPTSGNGLPRAKYGSLAMDVSGQAYASQNGAPNPPMADQGTNSITDFATRFKEAGTVNNDPYGFIDLYGLNPSSILLKQASNSPTATVSKEEYLSIMTQIVFGKKTILTSEGGDYRKDW
jgi:hypothetical protein